MKQRMKMSGYLIVQLEDRLTAEEAWRELIDNADDAGATKIEIKITNRMMSFTDNGSGTDNPDAIATPSMSLSRHSKTKIGSKGIGAKEACATFGRIWDIETVVKGKNQYRHHKLEWDEDGPLPYQFDGTVKPLREAPQEIRNGGTKITVTGRRDGFPSPRLDTLCHNLERIYRPALSSRELKIHVSDPERGFSYTLRNEAFNSALFAGPVTEVEVETAPGRSILVRYGVLKEYHRTLSSCHLIYGPRVVKTIDAIGKSSLPSGCYVDVILRHGWRKLLSTNKGNLARYGDELIEALETLLRDWIAQQKQEAAQYRLRIVSESVAELLNESIAFLDKNQEGRHQIKSRQKKEESDDDEKEHNYRPRKERRKHKRRQRGELGGLFKGTNESHRNGAILSIVPDEKLGHDLFGAAVSSTGNIEIRLNNGPRQREVAEYFQRGKTDELYKLAVLAFSTYVAKNRSMFPHIFAGLREHEYEVDEMDHWDIINKTSNFLIDAVWNRKGSIRKLAA